MLRCQPKCPKVHNRESGVAPAILLRNEHLDLERSLWVLLSQGMCSICCTQHIALEPFATRSVQCLGHFPISSDRISAYTNIDMSELLYEGLN